MEKRKVAYIVHAERPLNGILETQVFKLYNAFADANKGFDVTIYLFAHPLIYFQLFKDYKKLKLKMSTSKIKLKIIPLILIPERWEAYSVFLTKISFYTNILCYLIVGIAKFDFIICRSYVASFNMCKVKEVFSLKSNIIFDPRSVFPLERKSFDFFKTDDLYEFWIKREYFICSIANNIIYISSGMKDYFISLNNEFENKLVYLPLSFDNNIDCSKNEIYKSEEQIILLYVGSMNVGMHNNDVNHYLKRCKQLMDYNSKIKFVFVLPKVTEEIKSLFLKDSTLRDKIEFYEGKTEVINWLKKAHFGIYFLKEALDSHTRYGVKSVEYLCNGLPIIYDSGAGGIGEVVKENKCGINISDSSLIRDLNPTLFDKRMISKWAVKEHSIETNIQRLQALFK